MPGVHAVDGIRDAGQEGLAQAELLAHSGSVESEDTFVITAQSQHQVRKG